jgi:ketosteroid isomerase-like protein
MKTFIATSLIITSFLCNAQSKQDSLEEAKKAIAESNKLYFVLFAKNDPTLVNLYAEDACLMVPDASPTAFCGRAAIATFFKEGYEKIGLRNGKFTTTKVYGDGAEYVTEEGVLEMYEANEKLFDKGKYLVLWKKTKEGWKMYRDMFNSNGKLN